MGLLHLIYFRSLSLVSSLGGFELTKNLYGKLFADKGYGYISQDKKMVFITVLQPVDRFSVEHIP